MTDYEVTSLVRSLPKTVPFIGPETQERERNRGFVARIGANENVFGPSPRVISTIGQVAQESWMYGDPEIQELTDALAQHHGVSTENLVVGEGIDGLLGYTVRMFVQSGDTVVTSTGAYPTFNYQVATCGGRITTIPYQDDHEDPEALIDLAIAENARLIYLANPDNPMGSWWDAKTIQCMIDAVPEGVILCLDEAYLEFAPAGTAPPLDIFCDKVLRFRTFSKAYGLAGCRIGYAIGEAELIQSFDKLRNHFGVSRIAQAGALAALADQQHAKRVVQQVTAARNRIASIAKDNGLEALPSASNFVAIDCGRDGDYARRVLANLVTRGIFVRMPGVPPQDRCIRISAGTKDDLDVLEEVFPEALRNSEAST